MKRVLRTTIMALLVMLVCIGMPVPAANAAQAPVTIPICATVHVTGTPEENADATFELTAVTPGAPMPPDSSKKTIDIDTGDNEVSFNLTFSKVGVYEYTFKMTGGTYYLPEDGKESHVKVTVTNSSDYQSFEVQVAIRRDDVSGKPNDIDYFLKLRDLTVNKSWVDQDSSRPGSVEINLLCDSDVVDTVTLSSKNNWQHKWTGLDTRLGDYSVKEKKVPAGYTASYKENTNTGVWTVTNTGSLLQTGQLNWPIPVLAVAGMLLVAVGFLLTRKRKDKNA